MAKNIDEWLPITGSRNAKWWYATFHNVTAMVGAGVLGLPHAMSYLTWGPGVLAIVFSWVITLYTLWQMVEMHEIIPGKRLDRYHELGQEAFGEKLGLWVVVPQQLIVEIGVDIMYMVTGGSSLQKIYKIVCQKESCPLSKKKWAWILIFSSVHYFLAQLPNFNSISGISLAAAIMSLTYSTISWVLPVAFRDNDHPPLLPGQYPEYVLPYESNWRLFFGISNALGEIAFAFAGHNVVLEIQATIPSTPEKPSKGPMWRGCVYAYSVVALCYFPVAWVGYWAYGVHVGENIITYVAKPPILVAIANMFVVIHVIGSYQLYAMPVFDMLETVLIKKWGFEPSRKLRLITRTLYVAATSFVGLSIPFFSALMGFLGGFAFAPTTYFLPCIMWLVLKKPKKWSITWILNYIIIVIGVILMILSCIGGMALIIIAVLVVGHDWGAIIGWYLCLLRPDRVKGYIAVSVPVIPRGPHEADWVQQWSGKLGEGFYIARFQEPGRTERDFASVGTSATLKAFVCGFWDTRKGNRTIAPSGKELSSVFLKEELPPWHPAEEHKYNVEMFDKSGFTGPLHWYRNFGRSYKLLAPWVNCPFTTKAYYITGEYNAINDFPGIAELVQGPAFKQLVPNLKGTVVIKDAAHFVPEEKPQEFNEKLLTFLAELQRNT